MFPFGFLRRRGSRRGQAMVETAMVLPVLALLLLLGIDLGRIFFTTVDLRNAAHEASMLGAYNPNSACADVRPIVDQEMGRSGGDVAVCGTAPTNVSGIVYVAEAECERVDGGKACTPWNPAYDPTDDLRYWVRLEYRFQPVVPFVGLLTGNGVGGSVPMTVENRSPILVDYEGAT